MSPTTQRGGQEMGMHLQSAGMGLTDRILEMGKDSDLHACTDTVVDG